MKVWFWSGASEGMVQVSSSARYSMLWVVYGMLGAWVHTLLSN